jgi:hypothetical protein
LIRQSYPKDLTARGLKVEMVFVEIVERVDSERFDLLRKVTRVVGLKLQPDGLLKVYVSERGVGVLNDDGKAVSEAEELGVLRSSWMLGAGADLATEHVPVETLKPCSV